LASGRRHDPQILRRRVYDKPKCCGVG
jgi:hypothetical protein